MDSLPRKIDEADQHLDRLGGILRSLRAPPSDRSIPSNAAGRHRPARQHQHQQQLRDWQQQQQQQEEQEQEQDYDRRLLCASGSSRSRTASQSSQTETLTMVPLLHASRREQEAERGPVHEGAPTPKFRQRLGDSDENPRPSAPSSTVPPAVQPGVADSEPGCGSDGNQVATRAPVLLSPSLSPSLSLRKRAVRTWWRGLSCGVCFAAGAWAREGHGLYGVVLALVAVCGETLLYSVA